jgi:chromosome segregation ATPase
VCAQPPSFAASNPVEHYFQLRFEAAEARYGRMKALVCASLEKQESLQSELSSMQISNLATDMGIAGTEGAAALWETLNELKTARAEVCKLTEMNRCLRHGVPMEVPAVCVVRDCKLEGELLATRQQMARLELELVRLNDQHFEIEERLREYEDVVDRILGQEHVAPDPVHPRFHPMATCSSPACQNYAKRLRNGMRQAVAEAYVRDRNVRIHGHYQQKVKPLEQLRLEKDEQIRQLRLRLVRLECATLRSADDVGVVNEAMAAAVSELEQLKSEADAMRVEGTALRGRKEVLIAELRGLQMEVEDARDLIDESREKRSLCKAEVQCLEKERERAERAWDRVQSFLGGQMGVDFSRMEQECQALERKLEALQQRVREEEEDEDDAPVKRVGGVVFIKCRCGQSVPHDEIGAHILHAHSSQMPCAGHCGFFSGDSREMHVHFNSQECFERTAAIQRLVAESMDV